MYELHPNGPHSPDFRREQEVKMGFVGTEKCDSHAYIVFLVPGSRWGESRKHVYLVIDIENFFHLLQRVQTLFGFWTRQPVHQTIIEHIMATQKWILEDLEDGARCIDDCLEFEFKANGGVLLDLPDTSGIGIPSDCGLDVLGSENNGVYDTLCGVHLRVVLFIASVTARATVDRA